MFVATLGVIFSLAIGWWLVYPRTEYAPGFSQRKFRKINIGMSKEVLRALVGEPLSKTERIAMNPPQPPLDYTTARWELWKYSVDRKGGPPDEGYRVRWVSLSNDVVVTTHTILAMRRGKWLWAGL